MPCYLHVLTCVCLSVQYVLKQGYLTKAPDLERGGGALRRWRRRWFVLHEDGEVIYCENEKVSVVVCVVVCVCGVCMCVCVYTHACVSVSYRVGDDSHVSHMKPAYIIQKDNRDNWGGGCIYLGVCHTARHWMPLSVTAAACAD